MPQPNALSATPPQYQLWDGAVCVNLFKKISACLPHSIAEPYALAFKAVSPSLAHVSRSPRTSPSAGRNRLIASLSMSLEVSSLPGRVRRWIIAETCATGSSSTLTSEEVPIDACSLARVADSLREFLSSTRFKTDSHASIPRCISRDSSNLWSLKVRRSAL